MQKICTVKKYCVTLHRFRSEDLGRGLSYGVMVALQFLVLPV